MRSDVIRNLIAINQQFYQTFAEEFSATRQRLQPGVQRLIETIPPETRILDLGCGNGELWQQLAAKGHHGAYTGLDFSQRLLEYARANNPTPQQARFLPTDLTTPSWDSPLSGPFDHIIAFAVLHHIPGNDLRERILRKVHHLIQPAGRFVLSNWQFLNSTRWRERIQPWEKAGLDPADLEPDDYLLDWRRGGTGYRYVHYFTEQEMEHLASETGFQILETFHSDGKEGNLGLYQIWKPAH